MEVSTEGDNIVVMISLLNYWYIITWATLSIQIGMTIYTAVVVSSTSATDT